MVGLLGMAVQGELTGRAVKRFADRAVMEFGLVGGTIGIALMGRAPTGLMFVPAMLPNALWGLAMPALQSLMTRRVGEDEQGQLQGASNSVAAIAGILSPLFFGWIYSISVGERATIQMPGLAFYLAAVVLVLAALLGWWVGRKAERQETATVQGPATP